MHLTFSFISLIIYIIREINNLRVAFASFYETKNRYPGATDGSFEFTGSVSAYNEMFCGGFVTKVPGNPPTCSSFSIASNISIIKADSIAGRIKGSWYAFGYREYGNINTTDNVFAKNSVVILGNATGANANSLKTSINNTSAVFPSSLSVEDANYFDVKFDDGDLDKGDVIGVGTNTANTGCFKGSTDTTKTLKCALFFSLGL
jgi:hypothetical protein